MSRQMVQPAKDIGNTLFQAKMRVATGMSLSWVPSQSFHLLEALVCALSLSTAANVGLNREIAKMRALLNKKIAFALNRGECAEP